MCDAFLKINYICVQTIRIKNEGIIALAAFIKTGKCCLQDLDLSLNYIKAGI